MYYFEEPLIPATILRRKSQFTMEIELNGESAMAHCPTTGRIGNIELINIPCLLSKSNDPKRKTSYTVEAVTCDEPNSNDINWIGINQILSNKLVEHFIANHELDAMTGEFDELHREVNLGISKLDFLVGNTYLEVKTPLTTLNVKYGLHIKEKKVTPFSSTDRFTKHIKELTGSLQNHERAILLTVYQYRITEKKEHQKSTHYGEVSKVMQEARCKGVEVWELSFSFHPEGVEVCDIREALNPLTSKL